MQDLGGCRAVLADIEDVDALYARCLKIKAHTILDHWSYILNPKENGYRSVHIVLGHRAKTDDVLGDRRIEIQIRSRLQHIWATAVEVCDTFTGEDLKSSRVPRTKWGRFFALMGSVIAARENRPLVPNTPESKKERKEELVELIRQNAISETLHSWTLAVEPVNVRKGARYLLMLDRKARKTEIWSYTKDQLDEADSAYLDMEKKKANDPDFQAVLISVDSLAAIKKAYPNYFIDLLEFLDLLAHEIDGKIQVPKIQRDDNIRTVKSSERLGSYGSLP